MVKKRLDILLVDLGLFPSREKAKSSIMAGLVFVDGKRVDKPGTEVDEKAEVEVRGTNNPYVSRGGLKLEKALREFGIDLNGKVVLDVGASTGGFTDCALQKGAKKVFAVDVGYGQLAWNLRQDQKVVNLERTNIRYLEKDKFDELPDFATIDVSFISLDKVLPKVWELTSPGSEVIALIKPQFEAGREKVGKKGVVKDPAVHEKVIERVIAKTREIGFVVQGLTFSPIRGPEGNIEYLLYFTKKGEDKNINIKSIVSSAHMELD